MTKDQYRQVFARMQANSRAYPNYIFALTMGTGKTVLMATCIFYEFLLSNKWPKDERFCHNALVFAPDRTVLQALKEIEEFDLTLVVPPEYASFLTAHLRFHYLEDAGTVLSTLDNSRFNIVVSNTQKIILKRRRRQTTAMEKLFGAEEEPATNGGLVAPEVEEELTSNQRFEKLCRLEQLGIYVDEAHHAFGRALAKDMGIGTSAEDTSLRTTIDTLADNLKRAGTRVVACYNFTGTPYVGREVLPEVVYAYGLKDAIEKGFLKRVQLHDYSDPKTEEFVELVIDDFLRQTADRAPEGMLPKLAFFGATIDELTGELRPAVERALERRGISTSRILVNVGNEHITTNDDIREFNRLDTAPSEKQFILLVNKGREGWNCRSLFGVAMFRQPQSKVFVLQATMRCLRAVGAVQETAHVYLSAENKQILDEELTQNFRISATDLEATGKDKDLVQVRVVQPPVKIKLARVHRTYSVREKVIAPGATTGLDPTAEEWAVMTDKYRLRETVTTGLPGQKPSQKEHVVDHTAHRERRQFSRLTLTAEVARYLNRSALEIERILGSTREGLDAIVSAVNEFNEVLYDVLIPRLFSMMYDLDFKEETEEREVELVKEPPAGFYEITADVSKLVRRDDVAEEQRSKSFHLDAYLFDSTHESALFWELLKSGRVSKVYFTGMLTHGQSEFYVQYIDPDSHTVRSYYPDFLFQREDGVYVIVEVKADYLIDEAVVQAKKDFAMQAAVASGMEYHMIKATAAAGGVHGLLN